MQLSPCPSCKRHVRVGVASCPFCASALPALRARNFVPRAITRAAIFSAALAGCQQKKSTPAPAAGSAVGSAAQVVRDAAAPVADTAEAPIGSNADTGSAAGSATDDGGVADAGSGTASTPAMDKARQQKIRLEKDKKDSEILKQRHMAKPYGAPPARRRVV